jgi:poly(A) polymerase
MVGGAVRDLALGQASADLDLATPLLPETVTALLEAAHIKVIPTGIDHGTVTAVSSGTVVEVTTLRADVSTDGRRATVAFTDDWQADAARRDFTINALYADPLSGELFDYFGGLDDLHERRVRFIGDPATRIAEDHLRILRFFRFHARFAPERAPDADGLDACRRRANDLMALSRERIADELLKLLALPDPSRTLELMADNGIFLPVIPEANAEGAARVGALALGEQAAGVPSDPVRRLAALLPPDPAVAERIGARLKLSNKAKKRLVSAAHRLAPDDHPLPLAYELGTEGAIDRLLLGGRYEDAFSVRDWTVPRLPISGGDLIARGVTQGPEVARTLKAIEREWIRAGFPSGGAFDSIVEAALAT